MQDTARCIQIIMEKWRCTATCRGSAGGLRTAKELECYEEQEAATLNSINDKWIIDFDA